MPEEHARVRESRLKRRNATRAARTVTIRMKAIEQYFPLAMVAKLRVLLVMPYKVLFNFNLNP